MLMVIFGAGASYDSCSSFPAPPPESVPPGLIGGLLRPPVANQLFDHSQEFRNILQRFPQCQALVPVLERNNIEEELARLQAEAESDSRRKVQLLAVQFYLRDLIIECQRSWTGHTHGISNYKTLLDQVRLHEKVCFVTFNYDTLLEEALVDLDVRTEQMADYSRGRFQVFKPHGSIDWERMVEVKGATRPSTDQGIINAARSYLPSEFWRKRGQKVPTEPTHLVAIPALAIPVASKAQFVFPEEHNSALTTAIREVSKILIIGWKAGEQTFLLRLRQELPPVPDVLAVCGSETEANATLEALRSGGVNIKGKADIGGFSDFVASRRVEPFLAVSGA